MSDAIFSKVQALAAQSLGISPEKITMDSSFNSLGMDSLDALALVNELEEAYELKLPNEEVLKIRTVGQAVESIRKFLPV